MIPVFPFRLLLSCGSKQLSFMHVMLASLYVPLPLNTSSPRTPRSQETGYKYSCYWLIYLKTLNVEFHAKITVKLGTIRQINMVLMKKDQ